MLILVGRWLFPLCNISQVDDVVMTQKGDSQMAGKASGKPSDGADYGDDYVDMASPYWKAISKRPWYASLWMIFLIFAAASALVIYPVMFFISPQDDSLHFLPILFTFGLGLLALVAYVWAERKWVREMESLTEANQRR